MEKRQQVNLVQAAYSCWCFMPEHLMGPLSPVGQTFGASPLFPELSEGKLLDFPSSVKSFEWKMLQKSPGVTVNTGSLLHDHGPDLMKCT